MKKMEWCAQRWTQEFYLGGAKFVLDFVNFFHINNTKNILYLNRHKTFFPCLDLLFN